MGKNYTFSMARSKTECSVLKGNEIWNWQPNNPPTPLPRRTVASKMFSFTGLPTNGKWLARDNIMTSDECQVTEVQGDLGSHI
jgi:hypothetical protein